eukprot:TRINITY_DN2660_c0_g1_i2.p1 TRINITY_DN2660_c0_g1~~TRINITY_DN2660_c0_g1_i2.p1  ORF type:complete len:204 (+),score=21.13 TRINITY_DN2660_c0_g1_i2:184-795(+)
MSAVATDASNDIDVISAKIADLSLASNNVAERGPATAAADHAHVVEHSEFPETWADQDIECILQETISAIPCSKGGVQGLAGPVAWHQVYRLVWPDDLHILVVFRSATLAATYLEKVARDVFKLQTSPNLATVSAETIRLVPKLFAPPTDQPQRTGIVANRLVQSALGIRSPKSKGQEVEEHLLREQRRRNLNRKNNLKLDSI